MLERDADLTKLKPASYNPRRISDDARARLGESLRALGIVKPIIARRGTIVAGHQRTRAALDAGIRRGPVYHLGRDVTTYEEVRFNQIHNGTDTTRDGRHRVMVELPPGAEGWLELPPEAVRGNLRSPGATVRAEIAILLARYGPWGGIVALDDGEVIHADQYALACHQTGTPVLCFVAPAERRREFAHFLDASYGEYHYGHLRKDTFVQTFAQLKRLRGGRRDNLSPTYEKLVRPWLLENPTARVLDFGCGQGDYVRRLAGEGVAIHGVELFRRRPGTNKLDVTAINRMIDRLCRDLREHGGYDAVVCDYVLNSVDCPEAERSVLALLDLFVKPGGTVFFSGRRRERADTVVRYTAATSAQQRTSEFIDGDGFTANYRQGFWFYQRFHRVEEVAQIAARHGWRVVGRCRSNTAWNRAAVKQDQRLRRAAYEAAARYEFGLPLSPTQRLDRADDVLAAVAGRLAELD